MRIKIIIALLVCICSSSLAQTIPKTFSDQLLPDKEEILNGFIPVKKVGDSYSNGFTLMPADTFVAKMNEFSAFMLKRIEREKTFTELKKQDLAFFIGNMLLRYQMLYGYDLSGPQTGGVKNHTPQERELLVSLAVQQPGVNNAALFKTSASYRDWVARKIYSGIKKFPIDTALGFGADKLSLIKVVNSEVSDPLIKEYLLYTYSMNVLKSVRSGQVKKQVYQDFMAMAITPAFKADVKEIYTNYQNMLTNALSPDFSYPDINGKSVSLKSLRGKYVYIDVWATWCGPCIQQFPFLENLEKEFKDKIHFVSLSIDRPEDKKAWQTLVKEKNLQGIQLLATQGPQSEFIKKFNISGIPRFIIIDPQGKIAFGDAKAPNDPHLAAQFKQLLAQ
jgi:thiol-disulfide isomerase/thioredoxin